MTVDMWSLGMDFNLEVLSSSRHYVSNVVIYWGRCHGTEGETDGNLPWCFSSLNIITVIIKWRNSTDSTKVNNFLSTRNPQLLGGQRLHGMRSLPNPFRYDWYWESYPRSLWLESVVYHSAINSSVWSNTIDILSYNFFLETVQNL